MEEYDDPLYDAVFKTAGGKSVLLGLGTTIATLVPAFAIEYFVNDDSYYRSQVAEIKSQEKDVSTLHDASETLEDMGESLLAIRVQEKADSLTNSISSAQESLPPHLSYDVFLYGTIVVPLALGGLVGAIRYRQLKRVANKS